MSVLTSKKNEKGMFKKRPFQEDFCEVEEIENAIITLLR